MIPMRGTRGVIFDKNVIPRFYERLLQIRLI